MTDQRFAIVCSGWKCWPAIRRTLTSIDAQTWDNYTVCVTDDASDEPELRDWIRSYCDERGWHYILRTERVGAVHNQLDAIAAMAPAPEDVIVWVDPDGDRLKHDGVLERVAAHYADGSKLIYFQYDTDPYSPTCSPSRAYPPDVIRGNTYREFGRTRGIPWNHLRTMRAELFYEMEDSDFKDDEGNWFMAGTDSAFMFPALELARGSVKFVDEVMLVYKSDNELADWRRQPRNVDRAHDIILGRPPKCSW